MEIFVFESEEAFNVAVDARIAAYILANASASVDSAKRLVERSVDGRAAFTIAIIDDQILLGSQPIAGSQLAPIQAQSSNDPDDLLVSVQALIAHVNLSRTGS